MAIVLNGTTGITNDGGYTGDGVSFADTTPANTLVTTAGGNVGVGTASPTNIGGYKSVTVSSTTGGWVEVTNGTVRGVLQNGSGDVTLEARSNHPLIFGINGAEKGRFDTGGNFLVGGTSQLPGASAPSINVGTSSGGMQLSGNGNQGYSGSIFPSSRGIEHFNSASAGAPRNYYFTTQGGGSYAALNAAAFTIGSDYRLKENITQISGALSRVNLLKPSRFKYKRDIETAMPFGTDTVDGFIAHEVQEVVPEAVYGEKDAVDADGKIIPQSMDASKLIPLLTAAMQEQQALIQTLTARVEALEAK
jgi:hypothetical protein